MLLCEKIIYLKFCLLNLDFSGDCRSCVLYVNPRFLWSFHFFLFVCYKTFFVVSNQLFLMIENDPFPRFYLWSLIDYDVYFGN